MLQLHHRLTPGLLDFESRNSPLLSSQFPISERLQAFCFFHVFFKTGSPPFEKNGSDQTHLFANLNLELVLRFRFRFKDFLIRLGKALIYLISKKKEKVLRLTNKLILTFGMVSSVPSVSPHLSNRNLHINLANLIV